MEAVPRLPMISFLLKVSSEKATFSQPLKQYISQYYGEEPDSFNNEIHNLESLRGGAVRPTIDIEGIQLLKKYYCQLHFLKSRFPMEELQAAAVYFSWQDPYSTMACTIPDIRFELMCILYNIGALHSQLGAADQRITPDGMKIACTHFQCAAWAFQVLRENYYQMVTYISAIEIVHFMELVCLAQAQECILEKSMMDNRKASIIAKVAVQVVDYYKKAQIMLQGGVYENNYSDYVQVATFKEWGKYLNFKVAYHKCITLLYQGQQAEEQQKMGERVALYQAAAEQLEDARKLSVGLEKKQDITEALAFTSDFVEGKKKAAKNENDFIYHEEIPNKDTFPEVKGASLVKGIPFNITDVEVSGPDLFARLIPMEAHEASSLYSERKAKVLRQYGELIENKDQKLAEFMSSLQIEFLNDMRQATGIPQEIVDRAAALSAKPNAIQDLISSMTKLSNSFHEVESLLNEIDDLLKEEGHSEKEYQKSVGERPPSIIATDLSREAAKYKEAHNKANESNQNLHRAMVAHVGNLKTLSQPLNQLQMSMPSVKMPDPNIDESALKEVEMLLGKVEEMRTQRSILWAQLRDALQSDDITCVLVTKEEHQNVEDIFSKELQKHQHLTTLIEQNAAAQDNIIKAFIDAYARFSSTRRYLQGVITKRQSTINSLISSYDSYEDLLSKANKGIEFYTKLETNVTKLLQRIKSSCKVQQEEREQMLSKITPPTKPESNPTESNMPKLKDYLESMRKKTLPKSTTEQVYMGANFMGSITNNETQIWPLGVRPTPLGSELNEVATAAYDSTSRLSMNSSYIQEKNPQFTNTNDKFDPIQHGMNAFSQQYIASGGVPSQSVMGTHQKIPSFSADIDMTLEKRLKALVLNNEEGTSSVPYQQYDNQSYMYNSVPSTNVLLNKTEVPIQQGLAYANDGLNRSNHFGAGTGTVNQLITDKNFSNLVTGHINPPNANTLQPSSFSDIGTANINATQTSNFLQNQTGNTMAQMNLSSADLTQPGSSTFNQINSANMNLTDSRTSYTAQFSSYIPTHYQQINQIPPAQPILQEGQNTLNDFYASGYATSLNCQSSGLATVQSNRYYSAEVTSQPEQTTGIYSASYGTAQTYPTNQMQSNSYYAYDGHQNSTQPPNYFPYSDNVQTQNYNTPSTYNSNDQNSELTSGYNTNAFNQSQYSEGYVGAGSLLAPNPCNPIYMYTQAGMNYSYNLNNTTSSNGGLTSPQCLQTSEAAHSEEKKGSSTIDLLSGLDFSISQEPLEPEQKENDPTEKRHQVPISDPQNISVNTVLHKIKPEDNEIDTSCSKSSDPTLKITESKPLDNESVKKLFCTEIEKYEKFVDVLNNKTLNGSTNLDSKWKEIQDTQDGEGMRKNISVARCYPMKNRYPDILPYDHSRIALSSTEDDYINASLIKDISSFVPPIIVTQAPLQTTIVDFWTMIIEQHVKIIVCFLGHNENQREIYWPPDCGKDYHVSNMVLRLQSINTKTDWIERLISINIPERKQFATVLHLQFTDWPESSLPGSPVPLIKFVKEFIILQQQQKLYSNPIVIHCLSGIGRSGVACLLMLAILEATNSTTLPDLTYLANKLTSFRKNFLKDREHLKFAYGAFLTYMKEIISNNDNTFNSSDPVEGEKSAESSIKNDPLNCLDPFWASKRDKK
ncbi:tyrosine-protein phosphatase non-receptor type 23 isoform X2 [Coccinella septempunctata]|uniref:tyrosine-protein phosphatase non-receptor type 23 isoform X2 n=1 Tax=Coccinella septempunctata TaxID=41139 RepID=UPI001D072BDF|nr:tyrosine-protein phosphatase non-receptor type 23 isoform X2 [Coccinella septempunctata]